MASDKGWSTKTCSVVFHAAVDGALSVHGCDSVHTLSNSGKACAIYTT